MTAVRVLLATCALFTLALSSCPANYAIPYLVADSRELTGQQMSQQFEYSLPAAMPATPTVAIGTRLSTQQSKTLLLWSKTFPLSD